MSSERTGYWGWLEKWSATMFLVGGVAGLVSATLFGLELIDTIGWWRLWALAQTLNYLLPFVGLIGLYPRLAARAPRLSLVGIGVAFFAIGLLVVNRVLLAVMGHDRPWIIVPAMVGSIIVGFLVFGTASLRTTVPSRLVGLLLIGVAVTTVAYFAVFLIPVHRGFPTAANTLVSVTVLAIGYLLHIRTAHHESTM